MEINEIKKLCIDKSSDLKVAMKKMDEGTEKILFVTENELKLFGILTDGDIRRWILSTGEVKGEVQEFCNTSPVVVHPEYNMDEIKDLMLARKFNALPVLDSAGIIIDILVWEVVFKDKKKNSIKQRIDVPVVIMAGGKGTRLEPFTNILPKPLIPIGDKPIIEIIIDRFREYGANDFYISINHKSRMIKAFFEELQHTYTVHYIEENEPMGTVGSLKLLEGKITGSFFVSNCDILIESNYKDILDFHNQNQNDITLVASLKNFRVPYGVCEIKNGGILQSIHEKPDYHFLVNTGLYVLNSSILAVIPGNKLFHITHLIDKVRGNNGKVGVYPVSEKAWIDIGEWREYRNAIKILESR